MNDFWYIATVQAKQTSKPTTIQHEFLGYDTAAKKLLRTFVSDEGNLINMNSSGWEANKFVWEGSVVTNGRKIPLREAMTRKAATEFTATWEVRKTGERAYRVFSLRLGSIYRRSISSLTSTISKQKC